MRKALAETALVSMILAIAGGLVLTGVVTTLVLQGKEKVDIAACRANVELAVKSKQNVPIDKCFTNQAGELKVTDEDERVSQLSKQVADLLHDCKYQFAESGAVPWAGDAFLESPSICFVCGTFSLPKAQDDLSYISTNQFLAWLKTHYEKGGRTYHEYLLPAMPGSNPDFLVVNSYDNANNIMYPTESIRGTTQYAVVHYAIPEKRLTQLAGIRTDPNIVKGVGQLVTFRTEKPTGGTNWVFITPSDNLAQSCSIQFTRYPIG